MWVPEGTLVSSCQRWVLFFWTCEKAARQKLGEIPSCNTVFAVVSTGFPVSPQYRKSLRFHPHPVEIRGRGATVTGEAAIGNRRWVALVRLSSTGFVSWNRSNLFERFGGEVSATHRCLAQCSFSANEKRNRRAYVESYTRQKVIVQDHSWQIPASRDSGRLYGRGLGRLRYSAFGPASDSGSLIGADNSGPVAVLAPIPTSISSSIPAMWARFSVIFDL